jgi:[CysO sulfur-carrier protein]-S-L-cysteine hydrolase
LSMPFRLRIPANLYNRMVEHAVSEIPNECCGLLAGCRDAPAAESSEMPTLLAVRVYPLVNEAASPVEFLSEPRSMFQAVREMRQAGLDILAVYHSHPSSEPVPSRKDLDRNYDKNVQNLIISLKNHPPVIRAWWLDEEYQEAQWELG